MKMSCHVIFFLQILNLVPRVYTILNKTHSFHGVSGNSPENLRKLSVYEKFYDPGNHTKKQAFYVVNAWKPLSILFLSGFSFTTIHESQDCRERGEGIPLTHHYHFHPPHRHLDISRAITAESSSPYIGSSRTRTGNLWFPSVSR